MMDPMEDELGLNPCLTLKILPDMDTPWGALRWAVS
jgi:hypothetical protein